ALSFIKAKNKQSPHNYLAVHGGRFSAHQCDYKFNAGLSQSCCGIVIIYNIKLVHNKETFMIAISPLQDQCYENS
ncbi:unnamed protein product, partial [Tenebrio molitor]